MDNTNIIYMLPDLSNDSCSVDDVDLKLRRDKHIFQDKTNYRNDKKPRAIREQVWIHYVGRQFETKCFVTWCQNMINVFDYQAGHDVPKSKGGTMDINNLRPICSRCNLCMGNDYTIQEWNKLSSVISLVLPEIPVKKRLILTIFNRFKRLLKI